MNAIHDITLLLRSRCDRGALGNGRTPGARRRSARMKRAISGPGLRGRDGLRTRLSRLRRLGGPSLWSLYGTRVRQSLCDCWAL